ncbi:MAG: phosphoribosylglycinamide formyltransferase [Myxococcota bacterium]|nr:phosphoribosylglycinamide formyltransferase [Myxococcota bacterium]
MSQAQPRVPIGVLVSGSGTNLQALIDATQDPSYPARIAVVLCNRPGATGIERARSAGIPTHVVRHRQYPDRASFERELVQHLRDHQVQWVALAGFMRVLTDTFLDAFPGRVLNIHPALLPAFPGVHAQRQALEYGVRIAGATVHLVDSGTDTGPIVTQGVVPVLPGDTEDSLKARILTIEHQIYPRALRWAVEDRILVRGRKVLVDLPPGESLTQGA